MTPLDWVVYAFAGLSFLALARSWLDWHRAPVNFVAGAVYPHPGDPNWERDHESDGYALAHGCVLVCAEDEARPRLYADGREVSGPSAANYAREVLAQHQRRIVEEHLGAIPPGDLN